MLSAVVMVIALLGFLSTLIQSYRLEEAARRRDQVRAVLQSFADEFNRGAVTYPDPTDTNPRLDQRRKLIYAFFDPLRSPAATGDALRWFASDGTEYIGAVGDPNLRIRLGANPNDPEVAITHRTQEMDEATGTPGGTASPLDVSELLGEFTATWTVNHLPQTLTLRMIRTVDATGVIAPAI